MHLFFKCLLVALIPLVFTVTQAITSAPAYHRHVDGGYENRLPQPKVCAPSAGCMIGKIMPGYRIASFEAFMGIPYALPPIGDLRFSVSITTNLNIILKSLSLVFKYYFSGTINQGL